MVFATAWGAFSLQAGAALGSHPEALVGSNRVASAKVSTTSVDATSRAYRIQTTTSQDGSTVKEFINSAGIVFAVSWQGPWRPDLKQLLGSYYTIFQQENAKRVTARARAPGVISSQDFVIKTRGHAHAFQGLAYVESMLPAGVQPSELQ